MLDNILNVTSAKYYAINENNVSITAVIDGITRFVPIAPGNKDYVEIMRQVDAGELTIQDAD